MAQGSAELGFEEESVVEKLVGSGAGTITDEHWSKAKRGIVFIENRNRKANTATRGSGFIAIDEQKRWLLITCNHVLRSLDDARTDTSVYFGRTSRKHVGIEFKGEEIFPKQPFFMTDGEKLPAPWNGKRFDYTAVEVRKDVLEKKLKGEVPQPFSLRKCALNVDDMLYVVHYPKDKDYNRCLNGEHVRHLDGPFIGHIATTYGGSSGSPMLKEDNNELVVVGLHCGGNSDINLATRIQMIVDHMQGKQYGGPVPDIVKFVASVTAWTSKKPAKVRPESDVGKIPPSADLPSVERVLADFREQFIRDVEAAVVASELRVNNIIPQAIEANISDAVPTGRKQRNQILHAQLVQGCTREYLIKACDILIAEAGYTKMNELGDAMRKELEPDEADPETVLRKYRKLFLKDMEAAVVAFELRDSNIIPQATEANISGAVSTGRKQRNQILHAQLVQGCTREALIIACDIFIDEAAAGHPRMKKLGEAIKEKLVPAEGK